MTPEQMRALLSRADDYATPHQYQPKNEPVYVLVRDLAAALRTAADQLEAVRALHFAFTRTGERLPECASCGSLWPCDTYELLTADTAPQEDRDE
ncbi:hypothetical protein [Curtobacterium sp. MCSS17_015]|uniref:hypothetical protein n=1 Tax=Curtobacterium sp. MCSS17_015 TaxID=2175666 RepID=UPI0011B4581D|nr:hypothetical protein [Curtobacterium sp. MCSS17_015]WIB25856.1 hypothetical protein DEJ18_12470 [Curtobacterium sp. MCSS17_015]